MSPVPRDDREVAEHCDLARLLPDFCASNGNRAVTEMLDYLRQLVGGRKRRLRDPNTDVLTRLILGEGDDKPLSETQLLHQCIFLLNAGHETTTNLIGNTLHALTRLPEQKAALIAHAADVDA